MSARTGFFPGWLVAALCVGLVAQSAAAAPATAAGGAWTRDDLQQTADAGIAAAAAATNANTHTFLLLQLADALNKAGQPAIALGALKTAASVVGTSEDFMSLSNRAQIVEKLAAAGDVQDTEALLAPVPAKPDSQAALLGGLGAGRARSNDPAGATQDAEKVLALPEVAKPPPPAALDAKSLALAKIAQALIDAGALDAASALIDKMPDQLANNAVVSSGLAQALCRQPDNIEKGRAIAHQLSDRARDAAVDPRIPIAKTNLVAQAAIALAICDGTSAAAASINNALSPEQAALASGRVSDDLMKSGNADLARALAPTPDPADAASILDAARRALRLGQGDKARQWALAASAAALKVTRESAPVGTWYDHLALLGNIFGVLAEAGAYDEAIATVQPNDPVNRRQFYVQIVGAAARVHDQAAVQRLLPAAIDALKQPSLDWGTVQQLHFLTQAWAVAGARDAAQTAYTAWTATYDEVRQERHLPDDPVMKAEMQALVGDIPGAFATANGAGPLTAKPNPLTAALVTGMSFDNARTPPSQAETAERLKQVQKMMPSLVPGPQANALAAVAAVLASLGNVDDAFKAEAELEGEPRDVLAPRRDSALAAISTEQQRAGDLEAALSTALRMDEPLERLRRLQSLAAVPASP